MSSPPLLSQVFYQLILDQAIATVECSEAERRQFRQAYEWTQQDQARLQQEGMTPEQFEAWAERELKIRKFQQQRWGRVLNSYFFQRKYQLDQVVCSLIYLHDRNMAQELYFRIVEGEQSFAEVAHLYSQGTAAAVGGRTGPIELGKLHPQLARMFYGARPGQVWAPQRIGEWIVIAQLEAVLPMQFNESIQQMLLNELLEQWLQEQIKQRFL
ncbi:peptidylprolyl isomerase [Leptolyngbya sp. NK1-12]|uniref:peptidylprolyl isomerase n=1 Tax=Leptolyngbya sp. NK1-12 TaxID=2547451 RepID=A0AA97AKC1_9CYAN|nr:peptidylprolyl isomerase [Leptolyngbya sp. NK1-12]WNZ27659.1 peptidylprolyl isomerase [Leptolyngbya sp. NK1-12]